MLIITQIENHQMEKLSEKYILKIIEILDVVADEPI
jgi:hypothetical protein